MSQEKSILPKIQVEDEKGSVVSYEVTTEEFTIGSNSKRNIILPSDSAEDKHASIQYDGEKIKVQNIKQSKIMVNGTLLQYSGELQPGDQLKIGNYSLHISTTIFDREFNKDIAIEMEKKFIPIKYISSQGVGKVILVQERYSKRKVALKFPIIDKTHSEFNSKKINLFIREAVVTSLLEHPNIIPIYEIGNAGQYLPYYTTKYVGEKSLYSKTGDSKILNEKLKILHDSATAVNYAHLKGVWHGDINPSNILVGEFNEVYVIDWGIVSQRQGYNFAGHTFDDEKLIIQGTPAYMAPEQANNSTGEMGICSDVWAFGIMLFEALTGHHPVIKEEQRGYPYAQILSLITMSDFPKIGDFPKNTSKDLIELCQSMLVKEPKKRLQTLDKFIQILRYHIQSAYGQISNKPDNTATKQHPSTFHKILETISFIKKNYNLLYVINEKRLELAYTYSGETEKADNREIYRLLNDLSSIEKDRQEVIEGLQDSISIQMIQYENLMNDYNRYKQKCEILSKLILLSAFSVKQKKNLWNQFMNL